jgi:D-serine dehydratase
MSIELLKACKPMLWTNPAYKKEPVNLDVMGLSPALIQEAKERFEAFGPLLANLFPYEGLIEGKIQSPLRDVSDFFKHQADRVSVTDHIFLKLDSQLPIAGSIKARGGIYEVLLHTEEVFKNLGYEHPRQAILDMSTDDLKMILKNYTILVGSTGNLGLSIGTMSAKLGYTVEVHMSKDAKTWKKELLRGHGATVIEHSGDYSMAVDQARAMSLASETAYYIDDENSQALFLGYAVAALELEAQLRQMTLLPSEEKPLCVVIPCGVGGAPGGICYGLKSVFGDRVDVYFVEPTQAPCMALGLMTGLHDAVSIEDYGIVLNTHADGLAVGRPSKFAGVVIEKLIAGVYTTEDKAMIDHMKALYIGTGEFVEPSAACALTAPSTLSGNWGTMVLWMTGGRLVPPLEKQIMLK